MALKDFVSGFWVLVLFDLITPCFLGFALFGERFAFVSLKETRSSFNLPLTFSDVFRNNRNSLLKTPRVYLTKLRLSAKRKRIDNHVPDWLALQRVDRAPAQIRRWNTARFFMCLSSR